MSNFNNKTITSKGLELLSSALAGNTLEFTRIVMGSGTYEGDIGLIESLVSQKQTLDIKSITRKGSQVVLSTTLLQSAIVEDFYWKELGVFAKGTDGVEKLYMYGSASETSYISKDMLNEKMINVGVLVSNATNITATINNSLVYLSREELQEHDDNENAHSKIRTWVTNLFTNLSLPWGKIIGKPDTYPPSTHGHTEVTVSVNGFMSAADKVKLNGIATNANNYVHPGSGTNPHGTTKADIGLGFVQNYPIASVADAQAGASNVMYMTPYLVKEACKKYGGDFMGKDISIESIHAYTESKFVAGGGTDTVIFNAVGSGIVCIKNSFISYINYTTFDIIVDGVIKVQLDKDSNLNSALKGYSQFIPINNSGIGLSSDFIVPFDSQVQFILRKFQAASGGYNSGYLNMQVAVYKNK